MASWETAQTPLLASVHGKEFLKTCQAGQAACVSFNCFLGNVCTRVEKATGSEISLPAWPTCGGHRSAGGQETCLGVSRGLFIHQTVYLVPTEVNDTSSV